MIKEENAISFKLFNIDFNIHWTVIFFLVSLSGLKITILEVVIRFFTALLIISIHEIGHSFFCKFYDYHVYGITIHGFGGLCYHDEVENKSEYVLIAAGGIIFQFVLFVISVLIFKLINYYGFSSDILRNVLSERLIGWNLLIILFNLIPIKGFDGYEICQIIKLYMYNKFILRFINRRNIKIINRKQTKAKKLAEEIRKKLINTAKKNYAKRQ